MSEAELNIDSIRKKIEQLFPEMAERLGEEICNNIRRLSDNEMDPKSYTDNNKVKVVAYAGSKVEEKLHPFEYTVNSIGKIVNKLGW